MERYIDMQFPEEKKISAIICGEKYIFKAFFSFKDYEIVMSEIEKNDYKYRNIVAEIVLNHVCEGNADKLKVSVLPDELLIRYIDEIVKDSERIRSIYSKKADIEDAYERFVISVKENLNDEIGTIKDSLENIKFPKITIPKLALQQPSPLQVSKEIFNIGSLIPDMSIISDSLAEIAKAFIDTQGIVDGIIENFQPIIEMQQSFVEEIAKRAAQVLSQLPSLSFTKEEIEEMRTALRRWGECGWTVPGNAKFEEFLTEPRSIKDANRIASKYCSKEYMEKIFEETLNFRSVRKSDYSEAIDDYNDRRYKSCACILFSLIDAKLIRMQKDKKQGKLEHRDVGKAAVEKSKRKILNDTDIENTYFSILRFENAYACLGKLFEHGRNFVIQPDLLNRNFLLHGMLTRRVTKRDCDQLFLLYYNWLSLLEKH